MRNFEQTYNAYNEFQTRMERYWCLQYLVQESIENVSGFVWRDNLVRLDDVPYLTKVYGLPELKAGTRVSLQVQEVDTLLMELRTKFLGVIEQGIGEEATQAEPVIIDEENQEAA
jgi:exoribonuclease-2